MSEMNCTLCGIDEEKCECYETPNNYDLQNKIDSQAREYSLGSVDLCHYVDFKSGAKFVQGILMPTLENYKRTIDRFEKYLEDSGDIKIQKELSEANATIQSLKDENVKIKLENQRYKSELADAKYLLEEDAFENCDEVISNIRKALTQKAEDL